VYERGVMSVLLDDLLDESQVTLSLDIGVLDDFAEFDQPVGLPEYLITSATLPYGIFSINLSPTFGKGLDELLPAAPNGYAIDFHISEGDLAGAVQQLNGAADEAHLYGTVVIGEWKAQVEVFVNSVALDEGALTMRQVANLLAAILRSFTATPA
ncbi:MAG: hypothetical protein ABMA25_14595, partial [Ilumatobacteraceae bacterium]